MSSVYGVVRVDGHAVPPTEIAALETVLASRSPDGFKRLQHGGALFGNGLLCTRQDNSSRHHLLETEQHLLTADLRLENQDLLKKQLGLAQDLDDATLVLEAYRRWGADCPRHLRGDFAFAVWNKQARQLFCCRDHLAARPFYYALTRDFMAFASEPEALIQLDGVSAAPNEERIASLLVADYEVRELDRTWNRDVFAVMGGERLDWQPSGQPRKQRYWSLTQPEMLRLPRFSDYVDAFHEKFARALQVRTDGDTCALLLSGGMDSAAIAASTQRLQLKGLKTYSMLAPVNEICIESTSIRALQALECFQEEYHSFIVDEIGHYVDVPESASWQTPHPVDSQLMMLQFLAQQAGIGNKVLLHGAAGDQVQADSLELPNWLIQRGRIRAAWHECRQMNKNHTYYHGNGALARFTAALSSAVIPSGMKHVLRGLMARSDTVTNTCAIDLLNPEFGQRFGLRERIEEQRSSSNSETFELESLDTEAMQLELQSSNTASDRIAGKAGMVGRDVWADLDVVEFYCGLPLDIRIGEGWTKYLARRASMGAIPEAVIWRNDKNHLGWRMVNYLLNQSADLFSSDVESLKDELTPYVSQAALRQLSADGPVTVEDQDSHLMLLSLGGWLKNLRD